MLVGSDRISPVLSSLSALAEMSLRSEAVPAAPAQGVSSSVFTLARSLID